MMLQFRRGAVTVTSRVRCHREDVSLVSGVTGKAVSLVSCVTMRPRRSGLNWAEGAQGDGDERRELEGLTTRAQRVAGRVT